MTQASSQFRAIIDAILSWLRAAWTAFCSVWPRWSTNRQFYVVGGLLLLLTVAWHTLGSSINMAKKPVPPPAAVQLDGHRLVSFPEKLGTFQLAKDISDKRIKSGQLTPPDDELDVLGINVNPNNWYYMAYYRDGVSGRVFSLNITYYTGLLESVPHVPERCLVAGGNELLQGESKDISFPLPGVAPPWDNVSLWRTAYIETRGSDSGGTRLKAAQYHVFAMNGRPTSDWQTVRLTMGNLWLKYAYFAKVQVARLGQGDVTLDSSDRDVQRFLEAALPEVLRFLPTAQDVAKLGQPRERN